MVLLGEKRTPYLWCKEREREKTIGAPEIEIISGIALTFIQRSLEYTKFITLFCTISFKFKPFVFIL